MRAHRLRFSDLFRGLLFRGSGFGLRSRLIVGPSDEWLRGQIGNYAYLALLGLHVFINVLVAFLFQRLLGRGLVKLSQEVSHSQPLTQSLRTVREDRFEADCVTDASSAKVPKCRQDGTHSSGLLLFRFAFLFSFLVGLCAMHQ